MPAKRCPNCNKFYSGNLIICPRCNPPGTVVNEDGSIEQKPKFELKMGVK